MSEVVDTIARCASHYYPGVWQVRMNVAHSPAEQAAASRIARSYAIRFMIVLAVALVVVQLAHDVIRPEFFRYLGLALGSGACLFALHPTRGTIFHALLGAGFVLVNLSVIVPGATQDWVKWVGFALLGASVIVMWRQRTSVGMSG